MRNHDDHQQNKPFNDVIDHMQQTEGAPVNRGGRLPKPIKIIGYLLFGGFFALFLLGMILGFFL
ncbi:hypothetical protein [Gracilibacillus salinarum]|uniref:Amino acid transporter n=1 Tax=Gracilibacillus salinarum TaxID=2932255 RepID=A0ABY4GLE8_9BACI|nr:hypothetical protein [Gracilibacillus salinarum]UOQ85059.1 hypothetical protein MUN87_20840 [Gracilibacillus salinarum]